MKITTDETHNVAYVKLRKGKIESTVELRPGIFFDLDRRGQVIGIEVLSLDQLAPALHDTQRKKKSA